MRSPAVSCAEDAGERLSEGLTVIERRTLFKAALAAGGSMVLVACSGNSGSGGTSGNGASGGPQSANEQPTAKITAEPAVDTLDASVVQPVVVKVSEGRLTEVSVAADGKDVQGELAADGLSWASSEPLGYGKTYTYAAKATGTDNKTVELAGSFATVKPANQVRATVNPTDNAEVGVGMPIKVEFFGDVKDRATAEKALVVKPSQDVDGSWGWISDKVVCWRPKEYWPANITVSVEANLYGVNLGGGNYGKADVNTKFKIGRNQVVQVHTPDHVMKVTRNGAAYKSYPCSNGLDSDVARNTPNGTYIVMTREATAVFDNARYGYTNVNKKWACRISNHGEYIHENQDNAAAIGKTNNSHGCVNLLEADAKNYYDSVLIGDPVEVTGAKQPSPVGSDVKVWFYDWKTWQGLSSIK
jgi:lipoprotein-anchoring transpeptidase ErfK/SrfK